MCVQQASVLMHVVNNSCGKALHRSVIVELQLPFANSPFANSQDVSSPFFW